MRACPPHRGPALVLVVVTLACGCAKHDVRSGSNGASSSPGSGSGSSATGTSSDGARTPANDAHCNDPAHPHARAFRDQATAEAAGCTVTRVYGAIKDPKTGELRDSEEWIFCCPDR